ncbi:enoyl-CoA hydratase/isomerase family protein [Halorarius halobius]|uniref:enoyl-CoA hydratase/isomerase family protein n=1 Tax=Halorarius halobius TaxID=2962671 RepID=UPI0020CD7587|nr:enoyl-CoA hydratase/isomerase family protein [Halorarius halobius]
MSDSYERLAVRDHPDDDRIRAIDLDNVDRNNVLDERTVLELYAAIEAADRDSAVDAILLGTTGDVFCAGADLTELKEHDYEDGTRFLTGYFETMDLLRETSKPAVAAVEGNCVAGGNELVNACDLIVAGESARFGQPEVLVGSTAAGGALQMLPLIVGEKRAKEILLTGELIDATEAERYGLINRVVDDGDAEASAVELLQQVLDRSSPQAYGVMKSVMKTWTNFAMLHEEMARDITARVWASEEFRDRAEAFLDGEDATPRSFGGNRPNER